MRAKMTHTYWSSVGAAFDVNPKSVKNIKALIAKVRRGIRAQQKKGKFICYLSVPISPRGGGHDLTNVDMAKQIAGHVRTKFGEQHLWVVNPGAYELPRGASGGDYMAVWADVLGGADGSGRDFDMVYFVGPNDVWEYFGVERAGSLTAIESWLRANALEDPGYAEIYENPKKRREFMRYYGIRGSAAYSKGAHDEWNIVSAINLKREIGDDIAVYFNGLPVEPGDYLDTTDAGNQMAFLH